MQITVRFTLPDDSTEERTWDSDATGVRATRANALLEHLKRTPGAAREVSDEGDKTYLVRLPANRVSQMRTRLTAFDQAA